LINAAKELGKTKDPKAVQYLIEALNDDNLEVQKAW
jgi:HEAT repeat protein